MDMVEMPGLVGGDRSALILWQNSGAMVYILLYIDGRRNLSYPSVKIRTPPRNKEI